jgi:hypothetical protein
MLVLYPDTTTEKALGIDALLYVNPYEMLSLTEKSHTRRVVVNGRELCAKIVDYYGTPRHTEWSAHTLSMLEWNEVRAYHFLKGLQGRCVPEFLYHGSDLNQLWASAVTTYEGKSLQSLADERGVLPRDCKHRALESLRALHGAGVVHGDVALRNAVWRERDLAILWVDLEHAVVRGQDVDEREFVALVEEEEAGARAVLDGVVEEQASPLPPLAPSFRAEPAASAASGDIVQTRAASPKESQMRVGPVKRCKVLPSCCTY